jgi:hypothetical protein
MIEEAVAELVDDEPGEHGPGNLVLPAAGGVALLDLHHLGILGIDT